MSEKKYTKEHEWIEVEGLIATIGIIIIGNPHWIRFTHNRNLLLVGYVSSSFQKS